MGGEDSMDVVSIETSETKGELPPGMAYGEAPEDRPFQEWMEKIRKKRKGDVVSAVEAETNGEEKEVKPVDEFFTNWYEKAPVKVAYLQGKGRSLVAKVDLEPGDTVMRCFPYTWAADEKFGSIICRYCLAEKLVDDANPFSHYCAQCNQVWYCSDACRISDAPIHRGYECMILSSWELEPATYEADVITEMKLLVRTVAVKHFEKRVAVAEAAQKERAEEEAKKKAEEEEAKKNAPEGDTTGQEQEEEKKAEEAKKKAEEEKKEKEKKDGEEEEEEEFAKVHITEPEILFEDYEALISRPYDFPGDMIEGLKFWICDYLARLGAWIGLEESAESLLLQLIRNRLNSFSIWNEPSMRQRGIGVYVTPSFMNHDCNPNISLKRYSTSLLEFFAAKQIKAGEEISISYVDTAEELDVRRQKLRSTYLFLCRCQRCVDEDLELRKGGGGENAPTGDGESSATGTAGGAESNTPSAVEDESTPPQNEPPSPSSQPTSS